MPDWKIALKRRLRERGLDPTLHVAVVEELGQHLEDQYRSLISRGMSGDEAETNVLQELDDDALSRELNRAERAAAPAVPPLGADSRAGIVGGVLQDVRYAARALCKSPGFTALVAITLALGVGANAAIFSVVNAVMLRPLPYPQSDRLVRIYESNPERGWPQFSASHPNYLDWRAQAKSFEALAATSGINLTLTANQSAEIIRAVAVTVDFLPVLGIAPTLGRNFLPDEDRPDGNTRVVIVSAAFWKRRFGADPSIVGRQVPFNAVNYEVVGVLPPSFEWGTADILVPLAPDPARSRGDHRLSVIGRLKDGVTMEQAGSELATIAAALAQQYPDSNAGWSVVWSSFYDWLIPTPVRDSLVVLLGAVAVLLLIACANVANLLLARAARQQKELSIRVALGASRWRIVRQLLAESVLLAIVGGLAGLMAGAGATRLLIAYGPTTVPRLDEASFDMTVVLFSLTVALATAFVFGMIPAIQVSRYRPAAALQESARGSSDGVRRQRLRASLTVIEVALSVALLIGAGLLLRSVWQLQQVDPGFRAGPLMMARVALSPVSYPTDESRKPFFDRLFAETRALPGIVGVAVSTGVPLAGGNTSTELEIPGRTPGAGTQNSAEWRVVSPGFFSTMGISLRGEDFPENPANDAPVTIISEAMARAYWPGENPIGRQVRIRSLGNRLCTIIGVAADVHTRALDVSAGPIVYLSAAALNLWPGNIVWRSSGDPESQVSAIRDIVRRIDPTVPLYDERTLEDLLSESFAPRRFSMYLLGVFAGLALLLASVGLFGVMAYLVSQRTREIGVRLALGANRGDIFRVIIGRGMTLTVIGAVIGIAGAFFLSRVIENLLFSVSARDPGTFITVPALLVFVAMAACYVPARRAMRVDPVTALRAE